MTGRERVIKTITFDNPDRLPVDLWIIPAASDHYGEQLDKLLFQNPLDIARVENLLVARENDNIFRKGTYIDSWGCAWTNIKEGFCGQVKNPPMQSYSSLSDYEIPTEHFREGWNTVAHQLKNLKDKFTIASQVNPFERMQFIRGTENLMMDLAYGCREVEALRDIVTEYFAGMIEKWCRYDEVDAIAFTDDWGMQKSLLISPMTWREFFKPMYSVLIDMVKDTGKFVFFHSDGYIIDIFEDFISLGVDAINSQLWCMGVERVAQEFAGRITFWGEISRQDILPLGNREAVRDAAHRMKEQLFVNGGGLIGQSEVGPDVPLENIEEVLTCWNM